MRRLTHEEAMEHIIRGSKETVLSYEEAITFYLRERGLLEMEREHRALLVSLARLLEKYERVGVEGQEKPGDGG